MDKRLRKAMLMWLSGHRIPLTLSTELFNMGYDVAALELRYCA